MVVGVVRRQRCGLMEEQLLGIGEALHLILRIAGEKTKDIDEYH